MQNLAYIVHVRACCCTEKAQARHCLHGSALYTVTIMGGLNYMYKSRVAGPCMLIVKVNQTLEESRKHQSSVLPYTYMVMCVHVHVHVHVCVCVFCVYTQMGCG